MSLLGLPNELLLSVASNLRCGSAINAFACTNFRLYCLLDEYLYQYYVQTSNHSALPWASSHGLTNTVLKFLHLGVNLQATLENKRATGATALHLAARHGHLVIVEALIQSGADVNAQTYKGAIPLHGAVVGGHEHITRILIEKGADFMKPLPTPNRPTILHVASYFGFLDIVQLLLEKGMGIQVKDGDLQTPLHYAVKFDEKNEVWHDNITTVDFLLKKKAVKDSWDKSGQRPQDFAKRNPSSIIELLLQGTTHTTLDDAILLDQAIQEQRWRRKALEHERSRKIQELAAERAAKIKAREAEKEAKELLRKKQEYAQYQNRVEKNRLDDILRYEKQDAARESWAKARMAADNRQLHRGMENTRMQQNRTSELKPPSPASQQKQDAARDSWGELKARAEGRGHMLHETKRQPCSHSTLGLLKWKGKGRCDICEIIFAKHLFICADCGFTVCWKCNTAN
jgi:ankyrin repeat protein